MPHPDSKWHRTGTSKTGKPVYRANPKYGLNVVEQQQVKQIARKEDKKDHQVHQALTMSPADDETAASYNNFQFAGIPENPLQIMDILPDITQGSEREQRLGSKISLTGVNMKFFFHIPPSTSQSADRSSFSCRLLVLSPRLIQKYSIFKDNWDAGERLNRSYLRNGSDATNFQGDLNSLRFPVNTALFITHHDRYFTLNRGQAMGDVAAGYTNIPDAIKHMRLSLKVKSKNLRFGEPSETEPENAAYFALLLYAPNNGAVTTTAPFAVWGNVFSEVNWRNLN